MHNMNRLQVDGNSEGLSKCQVEQRYKIQFSAKTLLLKI